MFSNKNLILSVIFLLLPSTLFAEKTPVTAPFEDSLPQCATLLKQCFAHSDLDRANCFYSTGSHPFCAGTPLGELALERWNMAPNRPSGMEDAPGLLGPKLVDRECLKAFDNTLSSKIIEGSISDSTVDQLKDDLEQCYETITIELVRP